jgi:hypothetical protein
MSSIVPRIFEIYRAAGCEPLTGHSPYHFFNWRDAPFTRFLRGPELLGVAGLALQEVMFVEHFREFISPRRILIIGNAHGWSTIALALIFPDAKTIAIDPDPVGVEFTNRLIAANNLPARAVVASSPEDVGKVVKEHLEGSVDFGLIDAIHQNEAIKADFDAVRAVSTDDACYLFHDIINWNLADGLNELLTKHQLQGKVFTRTASGMALGYSRISPEFLAYLNCFADVPGLFHKLRLMINEAIVDPIQAYPKYDSSAPHGARRF